MSSNQNHLHFQRHTVSSWGLGSNVLLKCCSLRLKISSDSSSRFILQTFYYFQCFVEQKWFHLIGIICGLAIYNSTVVDLHFPLALYKKLLDVSPTLEDLKELSPTEARSHEVQLLFKMRSQSSVPTPKISLCYIKGNVPICSDTQTHVYHQVTLAYITGPPTVAAGCRWERIVDYQDRKCQHFLSG